MNNMVRTWEDEKHPAAEIELTDTQLGAIYGAWGHHFPDCDDEDPFGDECGFLSGIRLNLSLCLDIDVNIEAGKKRRKKKCCDPCDKCDQCDDHDCDC